MKRLLRQLSFRRRLLISFATLLCTPVLLVGIAAYYFYTNFIISMTEKSSTEAISLVCDDTDSLLDNAWSLCDMLTGGIKTQKYLRMDFDSIRDQYSSDLTGSMELASTSTYREGIFGVYVFGQNGGRYKFNYYSFKPKDQREATWYRAIAGSREATWFPSHKGSFIVCGSIGNNSITVRQPVMDKTLGMVNGTMVAGIKEDAVTQKIKRDLSGGVICITNREGNILFRSSAGDDLHYPIGISPDPASYTLESADTAVGKSMVVPDSGHLMVSRTLMNSNWKIASIVGRGFLIQGSKDITHIVILVLLIIAFSSLHVAMLISQSTYRPVQILYRMMEGAENGDFSIRYNYHSSGGLGRLDENFNQMPERIQRLISQIYEEQKKLKNSGLKALQAQIQSHFLYNSLDSVMRLLRMDKNRDAGKIFNELSTLSKIPLNEGSEVIIIEEELRYISSYLFIINMIYSREFEHAIECDSVLHPYRTFKLLLQSPAENVIAHVISMPGQKVFIRVRVCEEEDGPVLSAQDISRGMDQGTLENLQQQLGTAAHPNRGDSGYRLYGVNEHIHIFFGSSYGLTIASEPDSGAEVIVKIPKLKGDDISAPDNTL